MHYVEPTADEFEKEIAEYRKKNQDLRNSLQKLRNDYEDLKNYTFFLESILGIKNVSDLKVFFQDIS